LVADSSRFRNRFVVRAVSMGRAATLSVSLRPLVIFWEFDLSHRDTLLPIVQRVSMTLPAPLQLIGLSRSIDLAEREFSQLATRLRQLGVAAVIRAPEDLPQILGLVDAYGRKYRTPVTAVTAPDR
jgi:hypothetical protein